MTKMKNPEGGNELSFHFFSVHGGWYEDGLTYQIIKIVNLVGLKARPWRHKHLENQSFATIGHFFLKKLFILKEEGPSASKELEEERKKMTAQLGLFSPDGMNQRYKRLSRGGRSKYLSQTRWEVSEKTQHTEGHHAGGHSDQAGEVGGGVLHCQVSLVTSGLLRPQADQAGGADGRGQAAPDGQEGGGEEN